VEAVEILGVDVGLKKSGLARASTVARLAEPLTSVPTDELLQKLAKYGNEHHLEAIVIGLPRSLDSSETDQTAWVREWADRAKAKIQTSLYWQDEALTSVEAQKSEYNRLKFDEHALAATIILQNFLDGAETDRKTI
jgi:putative Holliday junction resolvase